MAFFNLTQTFTVPAGAGSYAPERIQLNSQSLVLVSPPLLGVTAHILVPVATASIELWLLAPGNNPTQDANYALYDSQTAGHTWPLASYAGAQIRVKSGGTSGAMLVAATAD